MTPFATFGPAAPGVEAVHPMIQEFIEVTTGCIAWTTSRPSSRQGTPGESRNMCSVVVEFVPTMRNFDGTNAIELPPFLKDVHITFNPRHLTEGVAIRVLAHFLGRDAERLYTSYTMRGICAGQLHDDMSWPGHINQFIKRYLTDDILGVAHDAVLSAHQKAHETENAFADRLESNAFKCTAVFSEQALAHYFVRGLAPATRAAVSEAV